MIISVPSWLIPGTWYENLRYISRYEAIKWVELLFYHFDEETRELFYKELDSITHFCGRFSFSVHMPDRLAPEHAEIIELTREVTSHYIIHPPASSPDRFSSLVNRWRALYGDIFFLENLIDRNIKDCLDLGDSIPICCDIGHLLMRGDDIGKFIDSYGSRIREIHLHGIKNSREHNAFDPLESWFRDLIPTLREFQGVLNLEVFSIDQVKEILKALAAAGLMP